MLAIFLGNESCPERIQYAEQIDASHLRSNLIEFFHSLFAESDDFDMFFDELKLGMAVEIYPAIIEKKKMLDFAHTYDNIPLHTDEEYAKASVFGQLIAPGVMSFMSV